MPPKRKSSVHSTPNSKKQKAAPSEGEFKQFYSSTMNLVNNLRDENDERHLVTPFVKLPSKKLYPDYYNIIPNPITVGEIQKKLNNGKYSLQDTDDFVQDFKLLNDNATAYNDPESWIATDSLRIYEFVKEQADQFNGPGVVETSKPSKGPKLKIKKPAKPEEEDTTGEEITFEKLPELCKSIINLTIDHEFPELGVISGPFIEDIDKKEYPDYFKVVENPTSFKRVISNIEKKKLFLPKLSLLENLEAFHDATLLIFTNAQLYNDPSSLIHQDSIKLNELFDEKFEALKSKIENQQKKSSSKLKLKLKNPSKKESAPKVKINLKLKPSEPEETPAEPPKKRGRKKKVLDDVAVKDEIDDLTQEQPSETKMDIDEETDNGNRIHSENAGNNSVEDQGAKPKDEVEDLSAMVTESNVMGKTSSLAPTEDAFIQDIALSSSMSNVSHITQQIQLQNNYQNPLNSLTRGQLLKHLLFPTHAVAPTSTLFEYKFPTNGYSSQSFSVTLPPDSSSFITLKIALHNLLHEIKKPDLVNGQGYANLTSDDEFQCKLFVNDDEVSSGGEVSEEKRSDQNQLLSIQYDLKLSYGLNIVSFECKVAPNLTKKIKKTQAQPENEEVAGRYTRHQLQQLKMSWEVEKTSFIIVCHSA